MNPHYVEMKALLGIIFVVFSFLISNALADSSVTVSWDQEKYWDADKATVQVITSLINQDESAAESWQVNVWSDSDAGGIWLDITETGPNTGIFEGEVFFVTTGDSDDEKRELRVSNGDTLTAKFKYVNPEVRISAFAEFFTGSPDDYRGNYVIDVDKSDYKIGDLVTIVGMTPKVNLNSDVQLTVTEFYDGQVVFTDTIPITEIGEFRYTIDTSLPPWVPEGRYTIETIYDGVGSDSSGFYLPRTPEQIALEDQVSPIVITPDTVKVVSASDAIVDFSVKAVDDKDGVVNVVCDPASGSLFPIGKTEVVCTAQDLRGNVGMNAFFVIVEQDSLVIPQWVKDVASFWINDEIDYNGFVQVIQYLVEHDVIVVPNAQPSSDTAITEIPSWIKTNAEFWVNGQITDAEFATGIEWLIQNGIIKV